MQKNKQKIKIENKKAYQTTKNKKSNKKNKT
jgi:hypothetical protein